MTDRRKLLIFDANDILFSTQYIYLFNINKIKEASPQFRDIVNTIINKTMIEGKSFFQSIMHREVEYILKDDEFQKFINYADYKDMLDDSDGSILLSTPYSKFMVNFNKVAIEANIQVVYQNDFEKYLLTEKLKDIPSISIISLEDLEHFLSGNILETNDYGLYTTKTEIIDKYKDKGFDIMIPNTLEFLKKYDADRNVYPMENLWTHVQ